MEPKPILRFGLGKDIDTQKNILLEMGLGNNMKNIFSKDNYMRYQIRGAYRNSFFTYKKMFEGYGFVDVFYNHSNTLQHDVRNNLKDSISLPNQIYTMTYSKANVVIHKLGANIGIGVIENITKRLGADVYIGIGACSRTLQYENIENPQMVLTPNRYAGSAFMNSHFSEPRTMGVFSAMLGFRFFYRF